MSKYINEAIEMLHRGFVFSDLTEREKETIYKVSEALQLAHQRGYNQGWKAAKEYDKKDRGFSND